MNSTALRSTAIPVQSIFPQSKSTLTVEDFISQALGNIAMTGTLQAPPTLTQEQDSIFAGHDGWQNWIKLIAGFETMADWHKEAWTWAWNIDPGVSIDPLVIIAPRGSGKSTCAENIAVALGALKKRQFILYLRASQEQANASVANIAALLESVNISRYFPDMSERSVSKFGQSKGWNRQILRTSSGFSVLGHGMDTALRGVRLEDVRPDLIILDDVDELADSPLITSRKIARITKSILPAGSPDVSVLAIQNLLLSDGVFARLAKAQPEFLTRRKLIGPIPAIKDLEYEIDDDGIPIILSGTPTWPGGQGLDICANQMSDWGVSSFLNESQHDLEGSADGMFAEVNFDEIEIEVEDVPPLTYTICAVDPAVTSGKRSHAQAIQIDGLGLEEQGKQKIYRLYSWEGIDSPDNMLRRAIEKACEWGAKEVAIETNQGGSLWSSAFAATAQVLLDEEKIEYVPKFVEVRASASLGDKESRAQSMLSDYTRRLFKHVAGQTVQLKKSLKRFPKVLPDDLTDASYWSWSLCRKRMKDVGGIKAGTIPLAALTGKGQSRKEAIQVVRGRFKGGRIKLGRR